MGQLSEDGSLRTQLGLGFWVRIWQAQSTDLNRDLVHLKSGRGSDDRSGWTFCPCWPLLEGGVDHEAMGVFPRWEL